MKLNSIKNKFLFILQLVVVTRTLYFQSYYNILICKLVVIKREWMEKILGDYGLKNSSIWIINTGRKMSGIKFKINEWSYISQFQW